MLQIEHLWVNYGESRVLSDVSLGVPAGQVVCLMGRNGVGKTTLLKAIMGLLRPSYSSIAADPEQPLHLNTILFDGQDLARRSPSQRARMGIGYVPQGRGIFPYLTVYENLLMGLEARTESKSETVI